LYQPPTGPFPCGAPNPGSFTLELYGRRNNVQVVFQPASRQPIKPPPHIIVKAAGLGKAIPLPPILGQNNVKKAICGLP